MKIGPSFSILARPMRGFKVGQSRRWFGHFLRTHPLGIEPTPIQPALNLPESGQPGLDR